MTAAADVGFVEMRLGKVVGVSMAEDHPAFCVVLDAVSEDRHLLMTIGQTEAFYGSTVEVEGASGVEWVDARPSDALNLVALVPAPILVAHEVLADAEIKLAGDSPEAIGLRQALQCEQMPVWRGPRAG